jgi:hypothetical protein
MASLQDYQHTVTRVHGNHNNKGELVGWWECRIPGTTLTCALTSRGASKYCSFMIKILLLTDKVLIAEKSWGLTPVGAQRGKKALTEVLKESHVSFPSSAISHSAFLE